MKRFLKKRWHSIPVGIITAVLVLGLVAGSVFAAYTVLTGTATVTVDEAITAEFAIFGIWYPVEDGFAMPLEPYYPGESDTGYYKIYNKSSVPLNIVVDVTGVPDGWNITGDGNITWTDTGWEKWQGLVTVPAATYTGVHPNIELDEIGVIEFTLTMTVPTDAASGNFSMGFTIARQ